MNTPQEPVVPDPDAPPTTPAGAVRDPDQLDQPAEYDVSETLEGYDEADAESFPASDPPSSAEPGV
jgi:hypothetical protein